MVDPKLLCRKHLLGGHVETHMILGAIQKKKNLGRFLTEGLVEVHSVKTEHDALAVEMKRRGYNHQSPLQEFESWEAGKISVEDNLVELARRCVDCRARIEGKQ